MILRYEENKAKLYHNTSRKTVQSFSQFYLLSKKKPPWMFLELSRLPWFSKGSFLNPSREEHFRQSKI